MQNFLNFITNITPLSDVAQKAILAKMVKKEYPKNHILVPDLSKCYNYYFVEKGLLRVYYHNDEREITDFFAAENGVVGPVIRNKPIKNFIHSVELLENCTLNSIHLADLEELFYQHQDLERLGRMIALQTIFQLQHRIDSIQFFSAKERYDDFLKTYPNILQRASLGHIASYLGMNQVTLSKIRKQKD
jgi:CRP/FNR family transcriptional regulator, anaerobic regulatory protein